MKTLTQKLIKASNNCLVVFKMNARQAWFHRRTATIGVLSWSIRMGLTIILYYFIFQFHGNSAIQNVTFQIAASGMVLYGIVIGFGYRDIYRVINREFKTGAIEIWLNKPVSYLQLKAAEIFGKNIPVVAGLVMAGLGFWFVTRQLPVVDDVAIRLLAMLPMLVLGLTIAALLNTLIGLSVVWILDAQPLFLIVDKLIMIFGGAFIPIGFFPPHIKLIGELLPTGAVMYSTQMFYTNFIANVPRFIGVQLFWVVTLTLAAVALSRAANRNLTVNGG